MSGTKCTSWLGHRFEGRYSTEPTGDGWPPFKAEGKYAIDAQVKLTTRVTYERDICTRCGLTLEKNSATQTAEKQTETTV